MSDKNTQRCVSVAPIACAHTEVWPLDRFRPHPRNPNTHPPEQLRLLGKIIVTQGWRSPVVVSRLSGLVIKGHGRLAAAKLMNLESAPVDLQDYASEAMELADLMADNQIAEFSEIDATAFDSLVAELKLDANFDVELAGLDLSAAVAALEAVEMPASVAENVAEIDSFNAMRRQQTAAIVDQRNTEKFLIVVYPSLPAKTEALRLLGLPADERYAPAGDLKITRRMTGVAGPEMPKTAAKNKTGATG